jgi:hypothetical protein
VPEQRRFERVCAGRLTTVTGMDIAHKRKSRPRTAVRSKRTDVRSISAIQRIAKHNFAAKASLEIALRADVDLRSAEYWLAGNRAISGEALTSLLRSDIGFDLLRELMTGATSAWWRRFSRQMQISELRRRQAEQQALLERLERGEDV